MSLSNDSAYVRLVCIRPADTIEILVMNTAITIFCTKLDITTLIVALRWLCFQALRLARKPLFRLKVYITESLFKSTRVSRPSITSVTIVD